MSLKAAAQKTLDDQKQLIASAAVLETGRIANKQLGKLAQNHLPMPLNMLSGTPIGSVVLANLLKFAVEQFRPDDKMLERVVNGMVVASYSEFLGQFNFDELVDELLSNTSLKRALNAQAKAEAEGQ